MNGANRILEALRSANAEIVRLRTGNPYHDAEGKFAHGPGGHGKHWAKRQRRKAKRKAQAEAVRREVKADAKDLKQRHRGERREMVRDQRQDIKGLAKEHRSERKSLLRDQARERARLDREHAREIAREKNPAEHHGIRETHGFNVAEMAGEHKRERIAMKREHREAHRDRLAEHHEDRKSLRQSHRDERQELLDRYRSELAEHGFRRKGAQRGLRMVDSGEAEPSDGTHRPEVSSYVLRQAPSTRTAKASSAESILRHVLRQRGWSAAWRRGELTDRQHLALLGDVRQYARGWLRHEAEVLFASYGRDDDGTSQGRLLGGRGHHEGVVGECVVAPTQRESDDVSRALGATLAHHVGRFFRRARAFIHEAILAGAMALHGPEPLTADDLAVADEQALAQAQYLDRFQLDAHLRTPQPIAEPIAVGPEPMTAPQFIARAEMYGDAVHTGAQAVIRAKAINGRQYVEERRIHGLLLDDMCTICRDAVAKGWQPIGTLPAIGDSECIGACHCFFRWRDVEGKETSTVRPMRGRRARLKRQPVIPA